MNRKNIVGARLKAKRIEKKLTRRALGERIGVTIKTIYCWEAGLTEPKAASLDKALAIFKMTRSKLYKGL